jgi:hypothetical protein
MLSRGLPAMFVSVAFDRWASPWATNPSLTTPYSGRERCMSSVGSWSRLASLEVVCGDVEHRVDGRFGDHDSSPERECRDLAASDAFVGAGSGDAEKFGTSGTV